MRGGKSVTIFVVIEKYFLFGKFVRNDVVAYEFFYCLLIEHIQSKVVYDGDSA